jgi:hypothetical protein
MVAKTVYEFSDGKIFGGRIMTNDPCTEKYKSGRRGGQGFSAPHETPQLLNFPELRHSTLHMQQRN